MGSLDGTDDAELLKRMVLGAEEAFSEIYRRHKSSVFRFALWMSGSDTLAAEVTQETFLVLIRENSRYDSSRGSLQAWLTGVARNHVMKLLERESRYHPLEDETPPSDGGIDAGLERSERIALVRQAVFALPTVYREAVVLCDIEEHSYEEAARALGCGVCTVRSRLHRGRELLTQRLRSLAGSVA
jgi:RNA polymerase sigma-70 factor (ECF subfamily)